MRRFVALGALALVLGASPAWSQGALFLNWDNCSYGGTLVKTFACNQNFGAPFILYPTVVVPQPMTGFVGVSVEIGIAVDSESTPPWWQTRIGECRLNAISRVKTVGTGASEGCASGATFVFERCTLRHAGTLGDFVLSDTYQPGHAYPTFNGGLPVPGVNRTWGAVKGLYR